MKWTLRKICKWFISHEVDLKETHANGSYHHEVDVKKNLQWVISHEVDLKKNMQMQMVHIT